MKITSLLFRGEFRQFVEKEYKDDKGVVTKKRVAIFEQLGNAEPVIVSVSMERVFEKGESYDILLDFSSFDFKGLKGVSVKEHVE